MERYIPYQGIPWQERVPARMEETRYQACQKLFPPYPPLADVISLCTAEELERRVKDSWLETETRGEALRGELVLLLQSTAEDVLSFLAETEYTLVQQLLDAHEPLVLENGTCVELEAALTLRKRMWCDVGTVDGLPAVCLNPCVEPAVRKAMLRADLQKQRKGLAMLDNIIAEVLYGVGYLPIRDFCAHFAMEGCPEEVDVRMQEGFIRDHLRAQFDCVCAGREILLLHESMPAPDRIPLETLTRDVLSILTAHSQNRTQDSLPPLFAEDEAAAKMLYLCAPILRPECNPQETVLGLRVLIKQGAPLEEVEKAFRGMIYTLPTEEAMGGLRQLYRNTAQWSCPWPMTVSDMKCDTRRSAGSALLN